jgi:enediyne biosynthesis protein E4
MRCTKIYYTFMFMVLSLLQVQLVFSQQKFFREAGEEYQLDNAGYFSHCVAMADYDNDGFIDIFVGGASPDPSVLYHNVNGLRFEEVPIPLLSPPNTTGGASWGDYDNDGDPDLYFTYQKMAPNGLYKNNGGTFANVAVAMGVASTGFEHNLSTGWVDFNNDGKLDLFITNHGQRNNLFINQGTKFVDVAAQVGISDTKAFSTGFCWGDFDNDNDQDLYVVRTYETLKGKSYLYRNDNGQLVEVGVPYHVAGWDGSNTKRLAGEDFGCAWADYDNDGFLDLYVSCAQGWNKLYHNEKGMDFKNVAAELNCADGDTANQFADFSVSCAWGDYDNDGDLDIMVPGDDNINPKRSEDRLYRNDGPAGFTEVAKLYGMADTQTGYGCTWGDIDNDGDLDLYLAIAMTNELKGVSGGGFDKLYVNELGNRNNWIEMNLVGTASNKSAIGARIRCVTDTLSQIREINSGSGYISQNMLRAHFGFGQRTKIDSIIVRWPSGLLDTYTNVGVNQILTMTEGSTTAVVESKIGRVQDYRLYQNYPNPFNPNTTIAYRLANDGNVKLFVYDITGRKVVSLVDNHLQAGEYSVVWNGQDASGHSLPSGIYFYTLQADRFVQTHKMVFVQ